jgi:hypothetical protein
LLSPLLGALNVLLASSHLNLALTVIKEQVIVIIVVDIVLYTRKQKLREMGN